MSEYLQVRLKGEWMGNQKGAKLSLNQKMAAALVERGVAEIAETKKEKDIQKPKKDKMMRPVRRK